jgi:sigma-54 dependent transcriptional regulator, acetoin dehydrogenase operon transcriptional activator AcoR
MTRTLTQQEEQQEAPAAHPCLFRIMQCDRLLSGGARHALSGLDEVTVGRGAAYASSREGRRLALTLPDAWISSAHARLTVVLGKWVLEDAGSKNGVRLNGKAVTRAVLSDRDLIEMGHTFFYFRQSAEVRPDTAADVEAASLESFGELRTLSPAFEAVLAAAGRVVRSKVPVVLLGETGTGKELLARALHQLSGRTGAFTALNCGALAGDVLESELFGYRKGAFSGADADRPGLIRSADHGTLLLDEIGDLPTAAQVTFLRALQEGEVIPVGGVKPIKVDVRVLAATHKDLQELVSRGEFRADLLARLSGLTLTVPPLRERMEDFGVLLASLLGRLSDGRSALTLSSPAGRALLTYRWPRNVRELEQCLAAAMTLAERGQIELKHLPDLLRSAPPAATDPEGQVPRVLTSQEQRHREELIRLLTDHQGNLAAVGRAVGKARMQVQRWLTRYGIDPEAFRPR